MTTLDYFPIRDPDCQLTTALDVSSRVFSGEWVSLPAMIVARDVIDSHTHAKATVALLGTYIDSRRDEIRKEAARGTIREELVAMVGLVVIGAVAWLVCLA